MAAPTPTPRRMLLAFALIAYAWFLVVMLWAIAFLADIPVATTVDAEPRLGTAAAVAVDLGLIALFAVPHSLLARERVKARVTRPLVTGAGERALYVLVASALLTALLLWWQPVAGELWSVRTGWLRTLLWVVFAAGWLIAVSATFMIDHLDFVGLRQAAGRSRPARFQARWLYRLVRHPLILGLLIAFWITPTMTVGHLVFAAGMTLYVAAGLPLEERDLRRDLGAAYEAYARTTPALVPLLHPVRRASAPTAEDDSPL